MELLITMPIIFILLIIVVKQRSELIELNTGLDELIQDADTAIRRSEERRQQDNY